MCLPDTTNSKRSHSHSPLAAHRQLNGICDDWSWMFYQEEAAVGQLKHVGHACRSQDAYGLVSFAQGNL
jgi:hypothetical protein